MTFTKVMSKPIDFSGYLQNISRYFRDETSSEMSYRTGFQNMLEQIFPKEEHYHIQHDPKATAGNKPDFIIVRNGVPLLYIEVKKVGENLDKIEKSSQASRYFGYTNLIISDYLAFRFYRNGQKYDEQISLGIAHEKTKEIVAHPEKGEVLARTIKDFIESQKEPIKSGKHLAKIMGGKAQRIRENTVAYLEMETVENAELKKMMQVIKESLVSDLDIPKFADLYAQTLVYGLFVARYNDPTLDDFSRQEARDLIPKSNPFLQHFFDHIAGANFPKRLDIIVSELCEVFVHANVHDLMEEYFGQQNLFGENEEKPDPVIHFYEDFLKEYDQTKKMEMGVFYTPRSVVHFIIRSVDLLLKKEFGIAKGLADNQKIWQEVEDFDTKKGKMEKRKKEFHKVQILDIATGTGTFLNEIIQFIAKTFEGREGVWQSYAEADLIPRLLGFELMMAPYTIAHLKLGMTLEKTGIKNSEKRLNIYLTNTLDEAKNYSNQIQMNFIGIQEVIAEESHSASKIKSERPVMVVIGNPPYSGESMNAHYTENKVYKVEPGGKQKLQEKNSKWLNDDYVKFIRFAESLIEKNGEGIVGMITAHGYIDNPTFRGMRWHLRKTFDKIYILDLHGNSNKKETTPEGGKDENVFDIKTGVSIILGVKKRIPPKSPLSRGEAKRLEESPLDKGDLGDYKGGYIPYNPALKELARKMRNNPTDAEKKLWNLLRQGEIEKYTFLRQKPLGNYIADFYCSELQLIVEADGGGHAEENQKEYDQDRTAFFEGLGIFVLRFWNNEILQNPEGVYEKILERIPPSPPLSRGEAKRLEESPLDKGDLGDYKNNPKKKELATVYHTDFFGLRREKQEKLNASDVESLEWKELPADCETWIVEGEGKNGYEKGFSVNELFPVSSVGIVTARDKMSIQESQKEIEKVVSDFQTSGIEELRKKYNLGKDVRDWSVEMAKKDVLKGDGIFTKISYRPFDDKWTYYNGRSKGFHCMPRGEVMQHFLKGENVGLVCMRQATDDSSYNHVLISKSPVDNRYMYSGKGTTIVVPLYLYFDDGTKQPNLDMKIVKRFEKELGMRLIPPAPFDKGEQKSPLDKGDLGDFFSPEDILDYVYAVLHSPKYREKYKAFLKTDFPRVPYLSDLIPPAPFDKGEAKSPLDKGEMSEGQRGFFWNLVPLGTKLRKLHLLEDPVVKTPITTFPIVGSNEVEKITFEKSPLIKGELGGFGKVFFNTTQYFGNVPENVWNFYIGGYQPAQKFLKDRKGKTLSHADIERYEEMIVALSETIQVMAEIDGFMEGLSGVGSGE